MTDNHGFGKKSLAKFPGWWLALGPGVVWMVLAQGSGVAAHVGRITEPIAGKLE